MDNLTTGVHYFQGLGAKLAYFVRGSGPFLVVQAAGWGISSQYLQLGFAPLEKSISLIYLEPRGSGASRRPEPDTSMATSDMADDLDCLRHHLGFNQIDLLGHSNGGTISLLYAERYPNSVRNLILVTHRLVGYNDSQTWNRFWEERHDKPAFQRSIQWYQSLLDRLSYYVADPERHYPVFLRTMGEPSMWASKAQSAADRKKVLDLYSSLHKVKARTLCLGCSDDPVCSANATKVTAEGISGSQAVILPNCGHFPWIEKPEEFFRAITDFLRN